MYMIAECKKPLLLHQSRISLLLNVLLIPASILWRGYSWWSAVWTSELAFLMSLFSLSASPELISVDGPEFCQVFGSSSLVFEGIFHLEMKILSLKENFGAKWTFGVIITHWYLQCKKYWWFNLKNVSNLVALKF